MLSAMASPFTLYAIIYSGACYQSFFGEKTKQSEMLRLQSKNQALKHLREAMQQANGIVSDEMLLTISLLAIHGSVRPRLHPRSSLPLYRDNEFYASVEVERTHLQALRMLVDQRGGLASLALHGLADMIAM